MGTQLSLGAVCLIPIIMQERKKEGKEERKKEGENLLAGFLPGALLTAVAAAGSPLSSWASAPSGSVACKVTE